MAPAASSRAVRIDDDRAVERRQRGEHVGIEIGERCAPRADASRSRRDGGPAPPAGRAAHRADRRAPPAWRRRSLRSRSDDEQRALARVGQIERRLKHAAAPAPRRRPPPPTCLYFACRSSRCQAAPRNVKTSAPSAKTLISRDGLSTAHTCPLLQRRRARAADTPSRTAPAASLPVQPDVPQRSMSMMSSSRPSTLARNTVRTPSARRKKLLIAVERLRCTTAPSRGGGASGRHGIARRRRAAARRSRSAGSRSSRAPPRAASRSPTRCDRPAPRRASIAYGAVIEERADVAILDRAAEQIAALGR